MTTQQISLVQETFELVRPISLQAARIFYDRLFQMDPTLRFMFQGNITEQGRKLMQMIGTAVGSLNRLDKLVPVVEEMGRKHAGYGVRDEHYATVGAALLWTLEKGLGEAFTAEVRDAWAAMYSAIATAMRRGATSGIAREVVTA